MSILSLLIPVILLLALVVIAGIVVLIVMLSKSKKTTPPPVQQYQPAPTQDAAGKFCTVCGKRSESSNHQFCPNCGNKF